MEANDVALLGFVTAAQKYVDKHINDGSNLGDLENTDIKKLKDELSAQLKFLNMSEEKKNDLLSSGEKAFDEYVIDNLEPKHSVIDELGQIFDVSFDDYDVKPIEEVNEIDELLDAYDIEESIEDNNVEVKTNELDEFGLRADDDILLAIANAAAKSDEELAKEFNSTKEETTLDTAFADVINNEQKDYNEQDRVPLSEVLKNIGGLENNTTEYFEKIELPKENNNTNVKQNSYGSLSSELKNISNTTLVSNPATTKQETPVQHFSETLKNTSNLENNTSNKQNSYGSLSSELKNISNTTLVSNPTVAPIQQMNILVNPGLEMVLEKEAKENYYNISREEERATTNEAIVQEEEKDYTLSKALAGLGKLQNKQESKVIMEEPKQEQKVIVEEPKRKISSVFEENVEEEPITQTIKEEKIEKPIVNSVDEKVYSNIMIAYPYLSKGFVISAYSQKDELANSYVIGNDYIILHRLTFIDIEELHEFVEIMMAHNYLVNVDEKQMIVDTIREITNREGAFLTNIFSIANQAKILNGEYEGYYIIEKGKE